MPWISSGFSLLLRGVQITRRQGWVDGHFPKTQKISQGTAENHTKQTTSELGTQSPPEEEEGPHTTKKQQPEKRRKNRGLQNKCPKPEQKTKQKQSPPQQKIKGALEEGPEARKSRKQNEKAKKIILMKKAHEEGRPESQETRIYATDAGGSYPSSGAPCS